MSTPAKILAVDDEPDFELLLKQRFRQRIRQGSLAFRFARHGEEALAVLEEEPDIGLLLLDINMPVMDGFGFLDAFEPLRAAGRTSAWVAMLTSSPDPIDRSRAEAHRAVVDYLVKPISVERARALAQRLAIVGTQAAS